MISSLKALSWGIVAALGALVLESLFSVIFPDHSIGPVFFQEPTFYLLVASASEEFVKLLIIANASRQFTEKKKLLLNAFLIGLGFALTESFFAYYNEVFSVADLYRGVPGIFLIHVFTSVIVGAFIARFRFRLYLPMLAWPFIGACAIHLAYNLMLITDYRPDSLFIFSALALIGFVLLLYSIFSARYRPLIDNKGADLPK